MSKESETDLDKLAFDYLQTSVIANGYTKKELIESAKKYQCLCDSTKQIKKKENL